MESKTPQFDQELDKILSQSKPSKKTCQQCKSRFEVFKEDIEMYKKLRVPLPQLCPDCRKQRRYGFFNNVLKFYKKECAAHKDEEVISTYAPQSPYAIFDLKHWWSKKWGGEEYARDYDLKKSFFRQFKKFNQEVPHPAILGSHQTNINSPYVICASDVKDSYFSSMMFEGENLNYCFWVIFSKDCLDSLDVESCEKCYQIVSCHKCYNSHFCQECENCLDSAFLYDCRHCQNCFGCFNLRHKKYCFFNEQLTKEEYEEKMKEINLGNQDVLKKYQRKFEKILKNAIRENVEVDQANINSVGDKLYDAKNCYQVFLTIITSSKKLENIRYSTDVGEINDGSDLYIVGPNVSLAYEAIEIYDSNNIKFSFFLQNCIDIEYSLNCFNCKNCFGCLSLWNKQYYIFNKQYSKEEYYQLLDKIKAKMLEDKEYGEFFPLSQALQPYNDTYAMVEFPLTRKQVKKNGWQWYDEPKTPIDLKGLKSIQVKDLPEDIKNVQDNILDKVIICQITGKPFRLIKSELEFYRKHNLPLPTKHPYQRMIERFKKRNPTKLWKDKCDKCKKEMDTSYPPKKQKELKIYCHKCYVNEIG